MRPRSPLRSAGAGRRPVHAAYGGLRWGELAGLRRRDVDFESSKITVAGKRNIGIPSFVARSLAVHIACTRCPADGLGVPQRRRRADAPKQRPPSERGRWWARSGHDCCTGNERRRGAEASPGLLRWRRWDSNPRPPACKADRRPSRRSPCVLMSARANGSIRCKDPGQQGFGGPDGSGGTMDRRAPCVKVRLVQLATFVATSAVRSGVTCRTCRPPSRARRAPCHPCKDTASVPLNVAKRSQT